MTPEENSREAFREIQVSWFRLLFIPYWYHIFQIQHVLSENVKSEVDKIQAVCSEFLTYYKTQMVEYLTGL